MLVTISKNEEQGVYNWYFYTGPDGIDEYSGVELSLGQCFEEIVKRETINGLDYT